MLLSSSDNDVHATAFNINLCKDLDPTGLLHATNQASRDMAVEETSVAQPV